MYSSAAAGSFARSRRPGLVAGAGTGAAGAAATGAAWAFQLLQCLGGVRDASFGVARLLGLAGLFNVLVDLALGRLTQGGGVGGHVVVDFLQVELAQVVLGEDGRAGEQYRGCEQCMNFHCGSSSLMDFPGLPDTN